ncbi:hypothetical protein [Notoacmeibacter ruber]|uniref:hypothetical protein n=1 Tax=Notoacmeibacter ruber TaxID=2670375 RepID=UPI0013143517|nr:hypothetical protein [Notoacmeibacter ruber]
MKAIKERQKEKKPATPEDVAKRVFYSIEELLPPEHDAEAKRRIMEALRQA